MLGVQDSELSHAMQALETFVNQKTREELAHFNSVIQLKLRANLLCKKAAPFLVSLGSSSRAMTARSADINIAKVLPEHYKGAVLEFVIDQLCKPLLNS